MSWSRRRAARRRRSCSSTSRSPHRSSPAAAPTATSTVPPMHGSSSTGFNPADITDGAVDTDLDGRHQRPGVHRPHASARALHALPRGRRNRLVLRHARRPGQPRRDAGAGAVPVPDQPRAGRAPLPGHPGDIAAHPGFAAAAGARIGERLDRRRIGRPAVVVDRTMRWDQARATAHTPRSRSPSPSTTWYLAEGATHGNVRSVLPDCRTRDDAVGAGRDPLSAAGAGAPIVQDIHGRRRTRARRSTSTAKPGLAATEVSAGITSTNACRSSSSARCIASAPDSRSRPATTARASPRRRCAGSSRKARPASSSTCICCSRIPSTADADGRGDAICCRTAQPIVKTYAARAAQPADDHRRTIRTPGLADTPRVDDRRVDQQLSRSSSSARCGGRRRDHRDAVS